MWLSDKQILAVDDTPSIRTFLRLSMGAMGAIFHEAGTAAEAIQKFNSIHPDVVVLDLGLPDRDGLTVLSEIRKLATDGYYPVIIILSVRREQAMIGQALALGADAYLTKPFMMDDLLAEIEKQLALLTPPPAGSNSGALQPA